MKGVTRQPAGLQKPAAGCTQDAEGVQRLAIFGIVVSYGSVMSMSEPTPPLNRRQTDGEVDDALRAAHRLIAEHAYRLYLDGGCDRRRVAEYWRLAKEPWLAPWAMQ